MKNDWDFLSIKPNEAQIQLFKKLVSVFQDWNSKVQLSSFQSTKEVFDKHILDSLSIIPFLKFPKKSKIKILDLGTGGGFPALPLAIWFQHSSASHQISFTALDSVEKKLYAVSDMAKRLDLDVNTLHGRSEDLAQDVLYREQFDVVLTRAFAKYPTLLELSLPFVKLDGYFYAYLGSSALQDLENKLETLYGGEIQNIHPYTLNNKKNIYLEIKKVKVCNKKFPRKVGIPKKNPITTLGLF